jgi:hypothetical protein
LLQGLCGNSHWMTKRLFRKVPRSCGAKPHRYREVESVVEGLQREAAPPLAAGPKSCFGFGDSISNLFRISRFGFRISRPVAATAALRRYGRG